MDKLIQRFKALGDETRFKIFLLLSKNQICVGGLARALGISKPAVSQHLKVLKDAELIIGKKAGYFMHYEVQRDVLTELQGVIGELAKDAVNLDALHTSLRVNSFDCSRVCEKKHKGCNV